MLLLADEARDLREPMLLMGALFSEQGFFEARISSFRLFVERETPRVWSSDSGLSRLREPAGGSTVGCIREEITKLRLVIDKWLAVDLHHHFGKSPNRGGKGTLWRRDDLDGQFAREDFFPKHA